MLEANAAHTVLARQFWLICTSWCHEVSGKNGLLEADCGLCRISKQCYPSAHQRYATCILLYVRRAEGVSLLLPVAVLHFAAFTMGYFLSKGLKFNEKTARTVSIETGSTLDPYTLLLMLSPDIA